MMLIQYINIYKQLLNSGLKVVVYNGQLDLICDTVGTLDWIYKLKWDGLSKWKEATRMELYDDDKHNLAGFYQLYKNFQFYEILNAGHMAPADNPEGVIKMLKKILS